MGIAKGVRLLLAPLAMLLAASVATAQASTNAEGGGGEGGGNDDGGSESCFKCWESWNNGASAWEHYDAWLGISEYVFRGNFHGNGNWSNCTNAISVAGHTLYSSFAKTTGEAVRLTRYALELDDEEAVVELLQQQPIVKLNVVRRAIQVFDDATSAVIYHKPIPELQVQRIAFALETLSVRARYFTQAGLPRPSSVFSMMKFEQTGTAPLATFSQYVAQHV